MGFYRSSLESLQDFINIMRLNDTPTNTTSSPHEFHPSPSLVPLSIHMISKSHQNHLPIVQYATMLHNKEEDGDHSRCAVCLSSIETCHMVRKLGNCEHAFHVECLDSWMELGHDTCPVCRARLSPGHGEELRHGKDPWRSERMVYLFGEDCLMEELQ